MTASWPARQRLIELVADLVPPAAAEVSPAAAEVPPAAAEIPPAAAEVPPAAADCVRVGVDGVDGAGKTCFADELAAVLRGRGRPVVRVRVDDFHHVRAVRYRRGRTSATGFWLDSYDYPRLWAEVLTPLGPGGDRAYRPAGHDLVTDQVLEPPLVQAPAGAVLILDGIFLHRDELAGAWDLSIFLQVGFDEAARRMASRDGSEPDPEHPSLARYLNAQRHYLASCRPSRRADVVIDNSALDNPVLVSLVPRQPRPTSISPSAAAPR